MKTLRLVMLFTLFTAIAAAADDSLDQEVLVLGSDEAILEVPEPWVPEELDLPPLESSLQPGSWLPPVSPPSGDWQESITVEFPAFLLGIPEPAAPSP